MYSVIKRYKKKTFIDERNKYERLYIILQGFLGWYMVKSGLQQQPLPTDVPRVSQYRLAAHLGSAFILYSMFLWQGLTQFIPINNVSRSYSSIVYYYHIYLTEAGN